MGILLLFLTVVLLVVSISRWKVHPFLALLVLGVLFGISSGVEPAKSVNLLMEGFAKTLQWIAIIMVLGTMIGEIATETGGAERIARAALKLAGEKRLPQAMGATGYIISIPVFVDVAYIMMQTVTEALAARSRQGILVVGLSLAAGLTATHALMPPTPGPLAVAGILEGQLGRLILINSFVAFCAMAGGLAWAMFFCRRYQLDYDREIQEKYAAVKGEGVPLAQTGSTWLALLPIFLPLVLIAVRSFLGEGRGGALSGAFNILGTPVVALFVGVLLALLQFGRNFSMERLGKVANRSIEKAALVIMITGAGGAFGHVIRESGMTQQISAHAANFGAIGFIFPFLLAAVFTTTTGSVTVSMITTASIMFPLRPALGISPEMTAALIGSGAFCVFHVNASFFWLLNRLHKAPVATLLKTYTLQSLCMGAAGLAGVVLLRMLGIK